MLYFQEGSVDTSLSHKELKQGLFTALEKLGPKSRVLALPPDFTRLNSRAGELTEYVWQYYGKALTHILPTIGTHFPMNSQEIEKMYGSIPLKLFYIHNWRRDVITLGEVPGEFVKQVTDGATDYSWPAQVNKLICDKSFDLVLSLGQVVPHEVVGMANHNKNVLIGAGGQEGINKSHFIGAVYGMERMMGRIDTPLRRIFDYAEQKYAQNIPIVYVLTVIGKDKNEDIAVKGLFIGDDKECYNLAAELSQQVNVELLEEPLKKVVVYMDPLEYKSAWLCNKSIYRSRMAIADEGELIVLAPGMNKFGEDPYIDKLIRKYGYVGTERILALTNENEDLQKNLSAAAHLIHGSSEGRFSITYCPGKLNCEDIQSINFGFADYNEMIKKYNPYNLKDGYNIMPDGEKIFYISKPALGLWAYKKRMKN